MKEKIIFSNIHEYCVNDVDCEHVCLKAAMAGVKRVLLGPSSIEGIRKYIEKCGLSLYTTAAYPSGAFFAEQKAEEIRELVGLYPEIRGFFVVSAVGRYLSGYKRETQEEMKLIKEAAEGRQVFYMTEAALLNGEQMKEICEMALKEGLDGIVSTTGFKPYNVPFPSPQQLSALAEVANQRLTVIEGAGFGGEKAIRQALDSHADLVIADNIDALI